MKCPHYRRITTVISAAVLRFCSRPSIRGWTLQKFRWKGVTKSGIKLWNAVKGNLTIKSDFSLWFSGCRRDHNWIPLKFCGDYNLCTFTKSKWISICFNGSQDRQMFSSCSTVKVDRKCMNENLPCMSCKQIGWHWQPSISLAVPRLE